MAVYRQIVPIQIQMVRMDLKNTKISYMLYLKYNNMKRWKRGERNCNSV